MSKSNKTTGLSISVTSSERKEINDLAAKEGRAVVRQVLHMVRRREAELAKEAAK